MARMWAGWAVAAALAAGASAQAAEYKLVEATSPALEMAQLAPGVIVFDDKLQPGTDKATGLLRFEEWEKARPIQKRFLALHPAYVEPTLLRGRGGAARMVVEKLHIYAATARFVVAKPAASIDLAKYATLAFVTGLDPSIEHKPLTQAEATPYKQQTMAHERDPRRPWCEAKPRVLCLASRYKFEGRLPAGIKLANQLRESGRRIADAIEFESEIRALGAAEVDQAGLAQFTGIAQPVVGAIEQNIFHVNQIMQFGKLLAVLQPHPTDAAKTVVTVGVALGIESDVLEKKQEFASTAVLRNLLPLEVLMGRSSFNVGTSISAGLPTYARNRVKAIAAALGG